MIEKGERYNYHSGIGEDGPFHYKMHEECDAIINVMCYSNREEWFEFLCENQHIMARGKNEVRR